MFSSFGIMELRLNLNIHANDNAIAISNERPPTERSIEEVYNTPTNKSLNDSSPVEIITTVVKLGYKTRN